MQPAIRVLFPLFILFLIFLVLPFTLSGILERNHIDKNVLLWANGLFFLISIFSFFILKRGITNKNPNVFVRSVTGGMMIKMIFCVIAVIVYVYYSGQGFNKRSVFISLFLYLIYLFTEVAAIMKMNKQQHV